MPTRARRSTSGTPIIAIDTDAAATPAASAAPAPPAAPRRQARAAGAAPARGGAPVEPGLIGGRRPAAQRRCSSATARARPAAVRAGAPRPHRAASRAGRRPPRRPADRPARRPAAPPARGRRRRAAPRRRPGRRACRAGQAAGPQAGQGPRRRPATVAADRRRRLDHPRGRRARRPPGRRAEPPARPTPRRPPTGERETRIPIKGVRKAPPQAMVASAFTAPHVTEFVTVDVTRTMKLVERLQDTPRVRAACKVSPAAAGRQGAAARRRAGTPMVNATLGRGGAGDRASSTTSTSASPRRPRAAWSCRTSRTPTGCRCSSWPTRSASSTATAREGRTPPADMAGGTITITNVGVFGVDTGTPILNPGESAILAFGAVRRAAVGATRARSRPRAGDARSALSFDHRLVDGELGSRVPRRRRARCSRTPPARWSGAERCSRAAGSSSPPGNPLRSP